MLNGRLTPALLSALLFAACITAFGQTADQRPSPITPAMEQQADAMVHKLTLAQKLALIGGQDSMFIRAEPSIGFPRLKMSDGPMGVRTWGPSMAYAAGINLAASWDRDLARAVGSSIGEDARARGVNFLLGPGVDIYRMPMNGRNFEYFGEDPYLSANIAVGYIDGLQAEGVSATVKHFALNDAEYDRHNENSIADERTLREIDLPPFEAAVRQAHTGAIMDSYNLINGEHATQNRFLNVDILRKEWGFRGIVMSDWGATYDGVAAANGGLDLEMPSGRYMNATTLMPAIKDGQVTEATIDAKVRRILRTALQFHFLDRDQTVLTIPRYNPHGNAVTLRAAEEGAVLLKNEHNILPLSKESVHSIAVLGPDAYPAVPGGGGSAHVDAIAPVSFMTGLSHALPQAKVYWNAGLPSDRDIYRGSKWCVDAACKQQGLTRREVVDATNQVVDTQVTGNMYDEDSVPSKINGQQKRRITWTGYYLPASTGMYSFLAQAEGRGHYVLKVNGKTLLAIDQREGSSPQNATTTLTKDTPARIELTYWPEWQRTTVRLGVIAADKLVDPQAVALAKMADVAVVSVGFSPRTESEGFDRTYALPLGQEALIRAVCAANPRTIVVLTSGGSVATKNWIAGAPVLLQTWYAGQQGGTALANLLFGDANPSGKLPISWEKRLQDLPAYHNYYEQPGTKDVKYSEGIFLGYRYFETSKVKPLFPFGFGLSYTTFSFSNLSVTPENASPDSPIHVAFDVKNTGQRAGAEVAQIYVGDPSASVPRPKMELKEFRRVMLQPGETKRVTVALDRRSLAYWDVKTHGWKVDPGKFIIYAGDSSENVPLIKAITVQ
jgi:beta-glucosidase